MEKGNYIKNDVLLIIALCLVLGGLFTGLFFLDKKTNNLENWSSGLYNWLMQK